MAFSYNETDLATELNKIRLYIGDVDSDEQLLQDEEIAYVQSDSSTFVRRCAACCRLICTKVARDVDFKLSLLSEKASDVYERYKTLAERFEMSGSMSYPWAGSVDVSLKEANEDDDALVKPKFRKGHMNYASQDN